MENLLESLFTTPEALAQVLKDGLTAAQSPNEATAKLIDP
jgi:hypothetical protein